MAHKDFIEILDGVIINLKTVERIFGNETECSIYFSKPEDEENNPITFPVSYSELKKKIIG